MGEKKKERFCYLLKKYALLKRFLLIHLGDAAHNTRQLHTSSLVGRFPTTPSSCNYDSEIANPKPNQIMNRSSSVLCYFYGPFFFLLTVMHFSICLILEPLFHYDFIGWFRFEMDIKKYGHIPSTGHHPFHHQWVCILLLVKNPQQCLSRVQCVSALFLYVRSDLNLCCFITVDPSQSLTCCTVFCSLFCNSALVIYIPATFLSTWTSLPILVCSQLKRLLTGFAINVILRAFKRRQMLISSFYNSQTRPSGTNIHAMGNVTEITLCPYFDV